MIRYFSFALAAAIAAGFAMSADAGTPKPLPPDPVVIPPEIIDEPEPDYDWGGFFIGVHAGTGSTTTDFDSGALVVDLDADYYGAHIGYLHDFGKVVLGGRIMYDEVNVEFDAVEESSRLGASIIGGIDLDRFMPYLHAGIAQYSIEDIDTTEHGVSYGIGAMIAPTDHLIIGLEYSHTEYSEYLEDLIGFDNNLTADTVRLFVSIKF